MYQLLHAFYRNNNMKINKIPLLTKYPKKTKLQWLPHNLPSYEY